jgi:hypothetical protein
MFTELPDQDSANTPTTETASAEPVSNVIKFPKKHAGTTTTTIQLTEDTVFSGVSHAVTTEDMQSETFLEDTRHNMIDGLCEVYTKEIFFKLMSMGYNVMNEQFDKDLQFVNEALHSALLRTFSEGHPIQDFVDQNFVLIPLDEYDHAISITPVSPKSDDDNPDNK